MNELVKEILNHGYADTAMKKQVFIYKRSRSKRIKDKIFVKLFSTFTKEKSVAVIGDVVLVEIGAYQKIINELKELEEKLLTLQENQKSN